MATRIRIILLLLLLACTSCTWQEWRQAMVHVVHIPYTNPVMDGRCGGVRPIDGGYVAAVDEACMARLGDVPFLLVHESFGHPFDMYEHSPLGDVELGAQCAAAAALGYQPHYDALPYCPMEQVLYYKQLMKEAGIVLQT